MAAQLGPNDEALFSTPYPELLREISGLEPEATGGHVRLDRVGVKSMQRLAIGDIGGGLIVALWPAELKPQAKYLYTKGRADALIEAGLSEGWSVKGSPHLAFWNSAPALRLYLDRVAEVDDYVRRWAGADGCRIGRHQPEEVRRSLWPWLEECHYVSVGDRGALEAFLSILGRRGADLRPALRLHHRWPPNQVRELSNRGELAATVRRAVNAVLQAAGEPPLPAGAART